MQKKIHPIALKDISKYLIEQNIPIRDKNGDTWVVTPTRMYNKDSRKLNAELGINKIHYYGNTNGKNNKKSI